MIAYGNNTEESIAPIANNGFWPPAEPEAFRTEESVDTTVTAARLVQSLRVAMADVNRQLSDFQAESMAAGITAADAIPLKPWQTQGDPVLLYLRAVYAQAHADLLERYRSISATDEGDDRGEAKDLAADDYRADARWAVSELTGRTHSTVELI